jgi:hypothetical protein
VIVLTCGQQLLNKVEVFGSIPIHTNSGRPSTKFARIPQLGDEESACRATASGLFPEVCTPRLSTWQPGSSHFPRFCLPSPWAHSLACFVPSSRDRCAAFLPTTTVTAAFKSAVVFVQRLPPSLCWHIFACVCNKQDCEGAEMENFFFLQAQLRGIRL